MNGPSARALREGGIGGSIPYKTGTTLMVKLHNGGPLPTEWKKKTRLQSVFGDYGHILRIGVQESQGVAFIEYEDRRDAEDAERCMNGRQVCGKQASVQLTCAADSRSNLRCSVDIEERVAELALKHRLDEAATARLASVFQDRSRLGCDLSKDFEELSEHLGASNKPSALVSMKLADLRAGRPIGPCKYTPGRPGHDPTLDAGRGRDEGRRRDAGHSREETRGREQDAVREQKLR